MSAAKARPRVALLGCGRWGANILRDLVGLGAAVVVVDPAAAARTAAKVAGAAATLGAWDGRGVDGVVIATPTSTHAAALAPFLSGSTPVMVEKPLCADPAEARRILAAARCPLRTLEKWRYHPAVLALAGIAVSGDIGTVLGLRTRRVQPEHRHADVDALWTLAPHDLAIAREVIGRVPPLRQAWREADAPDAGVTAWFADSATATPWLALEVSARRPRAERSIVVTGTDGIAWFDAAAPTALGVRRRGGADERRTIDDTPPLLAGLGRFLAWIARGEPPRGTLEESVETVEIIAALHQPMTTPAEPR